MILLCAFIWANTTSASEVDKLSNTESPLFVSPPVFQTSLDSGLSIYYVQNSELPLYEISAYIQGAGRLYQKDLPNGFEDILEIVWLESGTSRLSPEQFKTELANLGAVISVNVWDYTIELKLEALEYQHEKAFELFFDFLRNPVFNDNALQSFKILGSTSREKRNDKSVNVAIREFKQILNNTTQSMYSEDDLNLFTIEMLQNFHQTHVSANRTFLVGNGSKSFMQLTKFIETQLESWKTFIPVVQHDETVVKNVSGEKSWIAMKSPQTTVVIGFVSTPLNHPEKIKIDFVESLLEYSRCDKMMRSTMAISTGCVASHNYYGQMGTFEMRATTQAENTHRLIEAMQTLYADFISHPQITEAELKATKQRFLSQQIYNYNSDFQIAYSAFYNHLFGKPSNYIEQSYEEIKNMTITDVQETIQKYFAPKKINVLVVGDKTGVSSSLLKEFKTRELDKD